MSPEMKTAVKVVKKLGDWAWFVLQEVAPGLLFIVVFFVGAGIIALMVARPWVALIVVMCLAIFVGIPTAVYAAYKAVQNEEAD